MQATTITLSPRTKSCRSRRVFQSGGTDGLPPAHARAAAACCCCGVGVLWYTSSTSASTRLKWRSKLRSTPVNRPLRKEQHSTATFSYSMAAPPTYCGGQPSMARERRTAQHPVPCPYCASRRRPASQPCATPPWPRAARPLPAQSELSRQRYRPGVLPCHPAARTRLSSQCFVGTRTQRRRGTQRWEGRERAAPDGERTRVCLMARCLSRRTVPSTPLPCSRPPFASRSPS